MFLKKIELKGFKSFADRTVVDFGQGITCIVGPNGSGKSNVTDAFRWVLGEQRFKTLRGSQMQDIIFNGTTKRKALGFAEVMITFDNSTGMLPVAYTEVAVVRRLFRSGESEYEINGNKCRLKDVKELFMDTGVGVEGYSIIGQGRIESILSTNKDERRLILEEAAGIVKFRTRKEEAQRKLDRTGQNLERIEDIVKELEQRVGPLKEQAQKATEYQLYSTELRDLEINLFIHEVEQVDVNLNVILDDIEAKEKENHRFKNELEQHLDTMASTDLQLEENLAKEWQLNSEQLEVQQNATQLAHEIAIVKERHSLIETNIASLHLQESEQAQNQEILVAQIAHQEGLLEEKKEQYQGQHQLLVTSQTELDTISDLREAKREHLKKVQLQIEATRNKISEHQIEINRLTNMADGLRDRLVSLKQDVTVFEETQAHAVKQMSQLQHTLDQEDQSLLAIETQRVNLQVHQRELQDQLAGIEESLYKERTRCAEITAKRGALVEQENQQEGFSYAVKQVLDWSKVDGQVLGCVKDLFTVDKQYETAVETALGRNLQNLVVTHEDAVDTYIERLKSERAGRATFMPLESLEPREVPKLDLKPGFFGCAVHHIQCEPQVMPALQYILSNVYFAENLQTAKKASRDLPKGSRVVTLDGEVLNVGGTVTGGSLSKKETGFLKRKREIVELGEAIEELDQQIGELDNKRHGCQMAMVDSRKAFDDSEANLNQQKNLVMQQRVALDQVRQNISNASQGKGKLHQISQEINTQLEDLEETLDRIKREEASAKDQMAMDQTDLEVQESNLEADDKQQALLVASLTELRVADARCEEEIKGLERTCIERKEQLQQLERAAQRRDHDILNLTQTLGDLDLSVVEKQANLKEYRQSALQYEEALMQQKSRNEQLKISMQGLNLQVENLRNQVSSLNDSLFRLEIDKTKLETRKENILQNLWEKYELSYIHALDFKHEFDLKAFSQEAKRLKSSIKALGEVNIGAIKEYDTVSERYLFLSEQKKDLNEAKTQLAKLIKEMDKEMRQTFKDKLEEINGYFKETFSSLFGGGYGDIVAEGDEDILEAEIVIHAQPPGKKLQSLDLMSGGEKALTAIALLFAILKTKPSPFCILDEIEAALDDVNIFRFATFLQDFVQQSQFIIITHRKGTMEIAESLYGVTMQEQGISTVISVQLDNANDVLREISS